MSIEKEKLTKLKSQIKKSSKGRQVFSTDCAREACWEADIIILASPHGNEEAVAEEIRQVVTGKLVIRIPDPPCSSINALAGAGDANPADELQQLLPDSKVVKAFDTTLAAEMTGT